MRWEPLKGWSRIALAALWEMAKGKGGSQGREKDRAHLGMRDPGE